MSFSRLVLRAAMVSTMLAALGAGCGRHGLGRTDLDMTLSKHHIDLRWGRLENAAQAVEPKMRAEFVKVWADRLAATELQDIEIVGVVVTPDGEKADVVVRVTWVDRASMTVANATITERWLRTDDGWRLEKPALPEKA